MQAAQKQGRKDLEGKMQELRKDHDVLSELNKSLIANQKAYQDKLKSSEALCGEKDDAIKVCTNGGVCAAQRFQHLFMQQQNRHSSLRNAVDVSGHRRQERDGFTL